MSHLLHLVKFDRVKPSIKPLAFEFTASNEATPFLVSSSKSLLWINEAPTNVVRAAVRTKTRVQAFYTEVIQEVEDVGRSCNWGNVHPFTKEGVLNAISHVQFYDLGEIECLVHPNTKEKLAGVLAGSSVAYSICSWLSEDCVVVVPKDRAFLGFVGIMSSGFVSVIQNPSRGMAIVR